MIPKKIHLTWKDKNIFDVDSPLITYGIKRLRDLNPEWQIQITTDEEINDYLNEQMRQNFSLIEKTSVVAKTDIWRLYKMFYEGGMYMDIDRFCDVKLTEVIDNKVEQVLPVCRTYDFSHDLMISVPNNSIFSTAISMYLHRRKMGHTNIYYLGAQTYMHAITYTLLGEMVNTDPGPEKFNDTIKRLKKLNSVQIFFENPPYQTFLYRKKENLGDWEQLKRDFYNKSGLKHWTGNW